MRFLIFCLLALTFSWSQSQSYHWTSEIACSNRSEISGIATDSQGNVLVVGTFAFNADFDPSPGTTMLTGLNFGDAYIQKLDSNRNLLWVRQIGFPNGGELAGVVVDQNDNVIISGYSHGVVDFDPGPGVSNFSSVGNYAFIVKLDSVGDFVWMKGLSGDYSSVNELAIDAQDNIIIGGELYDTVDFDPGSGTYNLTETSAWGNQYLASYDSNGNFRWAGQFADANNCDLYGIDVDAAGNVYTGGSFYGNNLNFHLSGGSVLLSSTSIGAFILKIDPMGNFSWVKSVSGPTGHLWVQDMEISSGDRVHLIGYFTGTIDFDPGTGAFPLTSLDDRDVFIQVMDVNGDFVRATGIGGPGRQFGLGVGIDPGGSIYCTGMIEDSTDFDPQGSGYNLNPNGSESVFVAKYDSTLAFDWAYAFGSNLTIPQWISKDKGRHVHLDIDGNVYVGGIINDTVDFDPGPGLDQHIVPAMQDGFVTRLHTEYSCLPTSSNEIITACDSYTWQGQILTNTGFYYDTLVNVQGCDSLLSLSLLIVTVDSSVVLNSGVLSAQQTGATYQWFDCTTGLAIPNATNASFQPLVSGNYAVALSINGCQDTSQCQQVTVVGVEDSPWELGVTVVPNPSNGRFRLEFSQPLDGVRVRIIDSQGSVVLAMDGLVEDEVIDLSGVAAGVYFLQFSSGGWLVCEKLVLR